MLIAALFTIAKTRKLPLTDEWIKKMWYINTHHRILFAIKKKEILPFQHIDISKKVLC